MKSTANADECALYKERGSICPVHDGTMQRHQVRTALEAVLKDQKVEVTHEAIGENRSEVKHENRNSQDCKTEAVAKHITSSSDPVNNTGGLSQADLIAQLRDSIQNLNSKFDHFSESVQTKISLIETNYKSLSHKIDERVAAHHH